MITLYQLISLFTRKEKIYMEKVLGIVAEYNPFHNGHLYHLQESKKITNSDYTIAVISRKFYPKRK